MATFKGILKKVSGCVKKATMFLPAVIGGASILSVVGCGIATSVVYENATNDYVKTEIYQNVVLEDSQKLAEAYENEEISLSEYTAALDNIGTKNYVQETINKDIEGNEKWQGLLKTSNALTTAVYSCLGVAAFAGLGCLLWYCGPEIAEKLDDSAYNDFNWQPPYDEDKVKKDKENKEKKNADLSSDEETLGSLDEFLDNFTEKVD